ncbi:MAG: aminotransferase class I/II-fold pyridoxal phosphate-dependent enzyme [Kibdelosporangium sp.]
MLSQRAAGLSPSSTAALDARVKKLIADGVDVINLTGGEVDFPTPQQACAGGRRAIDQGYTRYTPVAGIFPLRQAIADRLTRRCGCPYPAQQVIVTNGAKQALANAFAVLLDPGDEVILQSPYWVSFPHMITLVGGVPVTIRTSAETGFKLTPAALLESITPRSKVLLINSPANPTGVVYDRHELNALAEVALAHGLCIVSDEIYGDLVYPGTEFTSVASLGEDVRARTVTVGGFSKTFAMTGWRVGFAAGPQPVIAAMAAIQGHTTSAPSSISQLAALSVLADEPVAEFERQRMELDHRRKVVTAGLAELPGVRLAAEPNGAFYAFVDVTGTYGSSGTDAATFAERLLLDAGVAVMPGADFGAPDHVRLSYAVSTDDLHEALQRMRHFFTHQHLQKEARMSTVTYSVQGMTCGGCAKRVRAALETDVPGLQDIEIDPKAGWVRFSSEQPVADTDVQAAVERTGYKFAGLMT